MEKNIYQSQEVQIIDKTITKKYTIAQLDAIFSQNDFRIII